MLNKILKFFTKKKPQPNVRPTILLVTPHRSTSEIFNPHVMVVYPSESLYGRRFDTIMLHPHVREHITSKLGLNYLEWYNILRTRLSPKGQLINL